ncbi:MULTISPECIES: DUF7544 domain-containing protein [Haloferacaceae]|uniref:Glycerophosphoryl diester phosphodiesterase membrane domain-containing protein n=1 Tax=Halorubrum glutamatedens TaxID=2707018 RepID=A0ABD5QS85_9EURY|nr:hypothetical protein [Halobellus captivus]
MSWSAVDAVDDAVEATRRFLFPFSLVRWAKLALLVLLMGGGVRTNVSVPFFPNPEFTTGPGGPGGPEGGSTEGSSGDPLFGPNGLQGDVGFEAVDMSLVIALVAVIVAVAIAFSIASISLRLVFYDALRTNEVRLWRPFVGRLRQALGLFVFSTLVSLVMAVPVVVAVLAEVDVGWGPADTLGSAVAGLPTWGIGVLVALAVLLAVVVLFVLRFTYEFVVPVMVLRDVGVLAGWRRFRPTLRESWVEFLLYLVVHFFLGVGISVAESFVFLFVGGLVAVFAGVAVLIAGGLLGGLPAVTGTTAGLAVLAVVVVIAVLALLILLLPVRILTRTYLIAYEVSTLGGIDPELALLDPGIDPNASGGPGGGDTSGGPGGGDTSGGPGGGDTSGGSDGNDGGGASSGGGEVGGAGEADGSVDTTDSDRWGSAGEGDDPEDPSDAQSRDGSRDRSDDLFGNDR